MYPSAPITDEFTRPYETKTPPWGFDGLGYVVFKRTYARPILDASGEVLRTEEWWETCKRVINGAQAIGANYTVEEAERLYDHMFNLRGMPGGRVLWQMGTANNKLLGGDSLVNCWFVDIRSTQDFRWMFDRLMLGGGVGFSIDNSKELGIVRQGEVFNQNTADADFIVPDTRQGWSELVLRALNCYLGDRDDPEKMAYSTMLVRPEGAPIKTFGGTASGPQILIDGVQEICGVLDGAVGRELTSTEVLDIANIIGKVVVSGNVRRSAQIALGSPHDRDYLTAKRWDLCTICLKKHKVEEDESKLDYADLCECDTPGFIPNYRAMSNNSVYLGEAADIESLPPEFWAGYYGQGEAYGMFNLDASQSWGRTGENRADYTISGTNPCGEIGLAHRESCNLAEVFLPNIESPEQLTDVAKLLYKMQKAIAAMPYLDRVSDEITSRNMRLGLSPGGIAESLHKIDWLDATYQELREFDAEWSSRQAWPESVRLTTVKPSGTLSLLAGVTPGIHPGFSQFHIRRVRMAHNDPVLEWVRSAGYPTEFQIGYDGKDDESTVVVEFPCKFPEGTLFADDMTAVDQLDLQRRIQEVWADNAISQTVYISPAEVPTVKHYLKENWHEMKSVSFMIRDGLILPQMPLEAIDEMEYLRRSMSIVQLDGHDLHGMAGNLLDEECVGGACPIR